MNLPPTHFRRIEMAALQRFIETCLSACGLSSDHTKIMAKLLTQADLRGIHSHGAQQLPRYVRETQEKMVNPSPEIRTVREEDTMVVVDGGGGFGYLPTLDVTERVIIKAQKSGLAAGAVFHIGHYGSAGHYTRLCAEAGCVGFAVQGKASVFEFPNLPIALYGSRPISFAIPAGNRPPIIVDGCTNLFREKDLELFTQVPSAFFMSLGFTVVSKLLGDALTGQMKRDAQEPGAAWPLATTGSFLIAIDVDHFTPMQGFGEVVDRFISEICSQMQPMPGHDRALLPGMAETERQELYRREGIPLEMGTCRSLEEVGERLGFAVPWK